MTISIYTQSLTANEDERTISGLLLPFGEEGATSAGRVTASSGSVTVPQDVSEVVLNIEHDGLRPVGRATSIEEREDGLHATFRVARTTQGNDLLEEVKEGLRACLSVEVANPVIRAGRLVAGALTGTGAVVRPAFPSAGIYALTAADAGELDETTTQEVVSELEGVLNKIKDATQETPDSDEEPTNEIESETSMSSNAAVPSELLSAAKNSGAAKTEKSYGEVLNLFAGAATAGDNSVMTAALTDIPSTPIFDDVQQPQWLGELWGRSTYVPKYTGLISHRDLTSRKVVGWKFTDLPTVDDWAGFPNEIPTSDVSTEAVETTALKLAGGWVLDRAFYDFGETAILDAFFGAAVEDYAKKIDAKTLNHINNVATSVTGGAVPTGVDVGSSLLVDGILALDADGLTPNFAIMGSDLYRSFLLSPKDKVLEFLPQGATVTNGGNIAGLNVVSSSLPALQGKVIVGNSSASTLFELPGASPVRVDALDIARGGVQSGVYGYYAFLHTGRGIVKVSKPA